MTGDGTDAADVGRTTSAWGQNGCGLAVFWDTSDVFVIEDPILRESPIHRAGSRGVAGVCYQRETS